MFSKLWYLVTLQWWKLELPSTDLAVLSKQYRLVSICPSSFKDDVKATLKFYNKVRGLRSKNVPSRKKLERLAPERIKSKIVRIMNVEAFREDRKVQVAGIKRGEGVYLFLDERKLNKFRESEKLIDYFKHSLLTYNAVDLFKLRVWILFKHISDLKDKLDKIVPKDCQHCGCSIGHVDPTGLCVICGSPIENLEKYLIKKVGRKIVEREASDSAMLKELSKSKYKDFLESNNRIKSIFVRKIEVDDEDEDDEVGGDIDW